MAAAAFLILEFVVSNRRIPHAVVAALLAALPPPSPRDSQRLRKALALRALDAALHDENAASTAPLLRKARAVLADPDMAACFPQPLPFSLPDDKDDDEVTAAAALADLKHILDHEWASLPPSTLELAADRIAGAGALDMWAKADGSKRRKLRLLGEDPQPITLAVGDSIERETLAKLEQDAYASHPSVVLDVDKSANALDRIDANETDHAQGDGEADLSNKNNEAECSQEAHARPQQESVKGAVKGKVLDTPQVMDNTTSHVTEQSARTNAESHHVVAPNRNLMVRDPSASTYEWDGLGHSDDERPLRHRQLLPFERKPIPSTVSQKTKKKWSKTQEKTLLEGIEKYGKGNWKDIKMAYPDVFEDRSTVDLKDKFRNMERHQSV
ncbi:hypothetical protein PR202_ga24632 [Eleusine coracana subsp. coracana]|uniref:Uncharacterized protein n=1 Tax=Eleusine coracana subsp. coracana TaxID=191504 RepID=A0AAV5D9L8_ELECO|nr:hypothetical protein PR202_ga24632 [Eleusine coracana subsp. coracana]